MKKRTFAAVLAVALSGAVMMSGCTRSQMNYQIAEAIGTDGMYENNEPVETPKMAEKRKLLEESESEEATLQEYLSQAEALAAQAGHMLPLPALGVFLRHVEIRVEGAVHGHHVRRAGGDGGGGAKAMKNVAGYGKRRTPPRRCEGPSTSRRPGPPGSRRAWP